MNSEKILKQAIYFLPEHLRFTIAAIDKKYIDDIKEIRLKYNTPVCIVTAKRKMFLKYDGSVSDMHDAADVCICSKSDMQEAASRLVNFSLHAYQNELKNGYITIQGGHRVGICATAVLDSKGDIASIRNISSLCIRIAREIDSAADEIINNLFSQKITSTLIVGEPSSGKTTILRDIARRLSDKEFGYMRVCVVDERGEIAASSSGEATKEVGVACDVLDGYPRADGIMLALRCLSPEIIICDEIGTEQDAKAIENVVNSGVKIIASIHSDDFSHLIKRPQFIKLMQTCAFDIAVILCSRAEPGKIKEIVSLKRYWR